MNLRTASKDTQETIKKKKPNRIPKRRNVFATFRDECDHDWDPVNNDDGEYLYHVCTKCDDTIRI